MIIPTSSSGKSHTVAMFHARFIRRNWLDVNAGVTVHKQMWHKKKSARNAAYWTQKAWLQWECCYFKMAFIFWGGRESFCHRRSNCKMSMVFTHWSMEVSPCFWNCVAVCVFYLKAVLGEPVLLHSLPLLSLLFSKKRPHQQRENRLKALASRLFQAKLERDFGT